MLKATGWYHFFVLDFSREPKARKLGIDFSASGDYLKVGTCLLAKAMKPMWLLKLGELLRPPLLVRNSPVESVKHWEVRGTSSSEEAAWRAEITVEVAQSKGTQRLLMSVGVVQQRKYIKWYWKCLKNVVYQHSMLYGSGYPKSDHYFAINSTLGYFGYLRTSHWAPYHQTIASPTENKVLIGWLPGSSATGPAVTGYHDGRATSL